MRGQTLPSQVLQNSSTVDFPGYSGRGYAVFSIPENERVIGQWIVSSLPRAGEYQILIFYVNKSPKTRRLDVAVHQNDHLIEDLFMDVNGSCERCLAAISMGAEDRRPYNFNFTSDMITVDIVFNFVDLRLDVIIVVPNAFSEFEELIQASISPEALM